jgi:quinolinate synthase
VSYCVRENLPLLERIGCLKEERKAVILAHNYQLPEVQDIADFVGDSLDLSIKAAETDAEIIVFCGVHFMAETAAILSPDKKVLLAAEHAGCPMANMISGHQMKEFKAEHPEATAMCYVNTSASVKAECDWCCTSANALQIAEHVENDEILFVPDKYLGSYIASKSNKHFTIWNGYCPTHVRIRPEDIVQRKKEHPKAAVIVHPECVSEVVALADEVLSTGGMVKFARESDYKEIIIGTEVGLIHRLEQENPKKHFYAATELAICPNMKLTNLEKILWSLEDLQYEIHVPEDIARRAKKAIDRMISVRT